MKISDRKLLQQVSQGHLQALDELYTRYGKLVYGFAYSFLMDVTDTEQVVSSAFAEVWEHADQMAHSPFSTKSQLIRLTLQKTGDLRPEKKRFLRMIDKVSAEITT